MTAKVAPDQLEATGKCPRCKRSIVVTRFSSGKRVQLRPGGRWPKKDGGVFEVWVFPDHLLAVEHHVGEAYPGRGGFVRHKCGGAMP